MSPLELNVTDVRQHVYCPAMREIRGFPEPDLPEACALVRYEADAIEFRLRETLSQFPRIQTDALVAQILTVTLGQMLDGSFLGLSRRFSTDLLNLGEPCILNIIFNDHKRDFHPLTLAGYALVLEAVYEFPVDVGVTVYASFQDGRLHIEREFSVIGDELRMEFVEIRDEKQRMVADELDPRPCEAKSGARSERAYNDHKRYTKGITMARFVVTVPEDFLEEIDARAKAEHRSRSELVREALRSYLRSGERREDISNRPEFKRAIQLQDEMRRRLEGSGYSGSEAVRKMRDRIY